MSLIFDRHETFIVTYPKEIGSLESLESEVIVVKVPFVFDGFLEGLGIVYDDFEYVIGNKGRRKPILGINVAVEEFGSLNEGWKSLLLKIRYSNPSGESFVLWVHRAEVGGSLGSKVIQLFGPHTVEYTLYYFLCNEHWVNFSAKLWFEVAEDLESASNLVKGDLHG